MTPGARKARDFYAMAPGAPLYRREFGYYCIDTWKTQGHIPQKADEKFLSDLFMFDDPGVYYNW